MEPLQPTLLAHASQVPALAVHAHETTLPS